MTNDSLQIVGFVGLGAMGSGMANTLLRAGFRVRGYDINPAASEAFAGAGGDAVSSVRAAAEGADALVVMVLNAGQAEAVLFGQDGAAAVLEAGAVVVLSSTVNPSFAVATAKRLSERGIEMLDAPVSGGTVRAAEGNLSMMVSGSDQAFALAGPLLSTMAANVYRMGDRPGQGSTMKLVNQILAGVHIAAAAEAIAFGARAGIDLDQVYEVICNSAGASWMFENRVPHILADDYTPHSAVEIWVKDLGLVLDTGRENRLPLPISAAAYQLYMMAVASGYDRLDDSAVVKVFEKLADFSVLEKR